MVIESSIIKGSITALALFMVINSITPGPNNIMLLQGGLKKGYWACRYHMFGIAFGVGIMLWLSYWGMGALITQMPSLILVMQALGTGYLLWLTYMIATSDFIAIINNALKAQQINTAPDLTASNISIKKRFGELPLSFGQATFFQWLNPKAWTMTALAPTNAMIISTRPWLDNLPLILMCMVINLVCISFWSAGGQTLRKLVHRPKVMRVVHALIVLMTLYCAVAMWL